MTLTAPAHGIHELTWQTQNSCNFVQCYLQMQAASTDDEFKQVVSANSDWLAGLGYCATSLNLSAQDSLLRELVHNELYNKYELLHDM